MEGIIKVYSRMLGTGYIIGEDGEKYFFYGLDMDEFPSAGERVTFTAEEGVSGGRPRAVDVKAIE